MEMDWQEFVAKVFALLAPALLTAIGFLVAFALASLKAYLDSLEKRSSAETAELLTAQVVGAVAQVHQGYSNEGKKAAAIDKLAELGVNASDADRLIEAEVDYRKLIGNGGS